MARGDAAEHCRYRGGHAKHRLSHSFHDYAEALGEVDGLSYIKACPLPLGMPEIGFVQGSAPKVGFLELRMEQRSFVEQTVSQVALLQRGAYEVGSLKSNPSEIAPVEFLVPHAHIGPVTTLNIHGREIRSFEPASDHTAVLKSCAKEIGVVEFTVQEGGGTVDRACQECPRKIAFSEFAALGVQLSQSHSAKAATLKLASLQVEVRPNPFLKVLVDELPLIHALQSTAKLLPHHHLALAHSAQGASGELWLERKGA